jgi:DNA-binding PadR family transcriptional regulator
VTEAHEPLPRVAFGILLALSLRPRHGYEIMSQVEDDSGGRVRLGPGSLYASIKQLRERGLVEEVDADGGDSRRRYYRLTTAGRAALDLEVDYYERSVRLATQRRSAARPRSTPRPRPRSSHA